MHTVQIYMMYNRLIDSKQKFLKCPSVVERIIKSFYSHTVDESHAT